MERGEGGGGRRETVCGVGGFRRRTRGPRAGLHGGLSRTVRETTDCGRTTGRLSKTASSLRKQRFFWVMSGRAEWYAPDLPAGLRKVIRVLNSLTGEKNELVPRTPLHGITISWVLLLCSC